MDATDDELLAMHENGMSQRQIALQLASEGKAPKTQQGVGFRLAKILDKQSDLAKGRLLPEGWRMRAEHQAGWIYVAALHLAKWEQGQPLKPAELSMAKKLKANLEKMDAVLTYDRDKGFQIRNRRPSDDGLFA